MKKTIHALGAVLLSASLVFAAGLATDSFNRTNANPLDGSWATITDLTANQIVSNAVQGTSTGSRNGSRHTSSAPRDGYAQLKLVTFSSSASSKGADVVYRVSASAETYYGCGVYGTGGFGTLGFNLYKRIAGSYTSLDDDAAVTVASNDVIKIVARGTTLKCYINNVEILSATDGDISAAGSAGIVITAPDAVTDVVFDDFEVGGFRRRILPVVF